LLGIISMLALTNELSVPVVVVHKPVVCDGLNPASDNPYEFSASFEDVPAHAQYGSGLVSNARPFATNQSDTWRP
jgi:hypothetical protein